MTNELFIKIIGAVLTILIAIITGIVVPWIKSKLTGVQLEKLNYYTQMAVRCAEMIYTAEQWEQKKAYVTQYITGIANSLTGLTLTDEDINVIIEGCVNEIKRG